MKRQLRNEGFIPFNKLKNKEGFFEYMKTLSSTRGVARIVKNKNDSYRIYDISSKGDRHNLMNAETKCLSEYVFVKPITMRVANILKNIYLGENTQWIT